MRARGDAPLLCDWGDGCGQQFQPILLPVMQEKSVVLTHGLHDILRHLHGDKTFPRDQRLRLETLGLRVLNFEGNPLGNDELEQQRVRVFRSTTVIRDREYPLGEGLNVNNCDSPEVMLPIFAEVPPLIGILRWGGNYELLHQMWSQLRLHLFRIFKYHCVMFQSII